MRLLAFSSTGPVLGSLIMIVVCILLQHTECKVAHTLPGGVPKEVKAAMKEMKKEVSITR